MVAERLPVGGRDGRASPGRCDFTRQFQLRDYNVAARKRSVEVFNGNVRLRTGTLIILGLFAFRTSLHYWRTRIEEEREGAKPAD